MKSFRNNRRALGAILLTVVCFVALAAPASADVELDRSFDERVESRGSSLLDRLGSGVSNLFAKLGMIWSAEGAVIED